MPVEQVVTGIIDLIDKNIIAKTNVTSNVLTDTIVNVENSFHFEPGQEIVLIDYGYNVENYSPTSHYGIYEYARIKNITDTRTIELYTNTVSNWYVSDHTFIQKTIGSSPLYSDRIYYGDREVIPTEEMAITVEPVSLSNEWIYIQGGLSEEYRISIIVYGKDIDTEDGMKVLNKYTDAIYQLFMSELHVDIDNVDTPILYDVTAGTSTVVIADTSSNRENFNNSTTLIDEKSYQIQDNLHVERDLCILNVQYGVPVVGQMTVTLSQNPSVVTPLVYNYSLSEFVVLIRYKRYFYDSRIDNIEYGTVQKGSAFLRAARLNWFGKEVEEWRFPQKSKGVDYFAEINSSSSSSES
jgi:hypothetical protein